MINRGLAHVLVIVVGIAGPAFAESDPRLDAINRSIVDFYATGRYAAGLPVASYGVQLAERLKGSNDPAVATALNNYGLFLVRANLPQEAEAAFRRALGIDETSVAGTADIARDLNNLAGLLQSSARVDEAEKLYVRALAIDERTLGSQHRDVARDLNNIAVLLRDKGKPGVAEPLQRRAITILEDLQRENPGRSNSDLATSIANFAAGLPRDRALEAEALYRHALELNERELGNENPKVAVTLNNLAETLRLSGKREEAETLFRRALDIDERVLGPQDPNVSTVLNNLAKVLRDTNRPAEAESLFNRALAIDQTSFGPMHPTVARDLKNLAKFYRIWNRSTEAAPLMGRVIGILQGVERQTGRPVPEIGPALNFQGQILAETHRLSEAESCYRNALALDEKNYGMQSAQVAKDLAALGLILNATQRSWEAAEVMRRADEITAKDAKDASVSRATRQCSGYACGIDVDDGI